MWLCHLHIWKDISTASPWPTPWHQNNYRFWIMSQTHSREVAAKSQSYLRKGFGFHSFQYSARPNKLLVGSVQESVSHDTETIWWCCYGYHLCLWTVSGGVCRHRHPWLESEGKCVSLDVVSCGNASHGTKTWKVRWRERDHQQMCLTQIEFILILSHKIDLRWIKKKPKLEAGSPGYLAHLEKFPGFFILS